MPNPSVDDLVSIIERWQGSRKPLAQGFTKDGLAEFVATMNAMSRQLISITGKQDPDFWSAWIELGTQAATMSAGAKLFVGRRDRTND